MVINNIKESLTKSLNKSWKSDVVVKSIVYNTLIDFFIKEKNIDIKKYIKWINKKWNIIIVKTWKSILNTEIINYKWVIENTVKEKLEKIWIKINKIDIIFK